uniref:Fam20C domain-containing protein n=1 Tax=Soboliphyme baturini TaxID=241478 RepID=A0A183IDV5_9BILA
LCTVYRLSFSQRYPWSQFYLNIGNCRVYQDGTALNDVLRDMRQLPIQNVSLMRGGTQIKLRITLENGGEVVFKPMRLHPDQESDPNQFYFTHFERYNSEIAGFHLDRLLGFRRALPTVPRVLDLKEVLSKAENDLSETFFISPIGNLCFFGVCKYYCATQHAICGSPFMKIGSFQVFLPKDTIFNMSHVISPYRRTYSRKRQKAEWQLYANYCEKSVRHSYRFRSGRRLLDLVDMSIFDFLIGNQDRHHYDYLQKFGDSSAFLHIDNGKGFGSPDTDDLDILAPLAQCCIIRPSTLKRLIDFYTGPVSMSSALRASLSQDSVSLHLGMKHYAAIDRRLKLILRTVDNCLNVSNGDVSSVLVPIL